MAKGNFMDLARKTAGAGIVMLLDRYRLILAVEGSKDSKIYQTLFGKYVFVNPNIGKESVLEAVGKVENNLRYRDRCRALVDRDYDFYFGKESKSATVVYTDAHSLETQLWKLDDNGLMLSKILSEIITTPEAFFEAQQKLECIYELAFDAAFKIGIFRMANEKNGWWISFKNVKLLPSMFDQESEKLNIEKYIRAACLATNSNFPSRKIDEIILRVDRLLKKDWDKWTIMQGHDIGSAFIWYLKKKTRIPQTMWCEPEAAVNDFEKRTRYVCLMDRLRNERFYKTIMTWVTSAN